MHLISLERKGNIYKVYFKENNKFLGDIVQGDDGEFVYFPIQNGGAWSAYPMMEIAIKLFFLNNTDREYINEETKEPKH